MDEPTARYLHPIAGLDAAMWVLLPVLLLELGLAQNPRR
jgi:hypothetical protein